MCVCGGIIFITKHLYSHETRKYSAKNSVSCKVLLVVYKRSTKVLTTTPVNTQEDKTRKNYNSPRHFCVLVLISVEGNICVYQPTCRTKCNGVEMQM